MLSVTSHHSRLLICSLEHGRDLLEQVTQLCRDNDIQTATLRGCGIIADVALSHYNPAEKNYQPFFTGQGPFSLVTLEGNVSLLGDQLVVNSFAVCAWSDRGQSMVVAGHLQSARVVTLELSLTATDDVAMVRSFDTRTGLPLWSSVNRLQPEVGEPPSAPARPAEPVSAANTQAGKQPASEHHSPAPTFDQTPPAGAGEQGPPPEEQDQEEAVQSEDAGGWQDAINLSMELDEQGDGDEELKRGDVLIHPRFGRCKVLQEEGEKAIIRNQSGNKVTLSLSVLTLVYEGEDGAGHQIFRVKLGRPRNH